MPPKIKIVDVGDKDFKNDEYAVTVDEIEKSELPTENDASEATEETTAIIQEKDAGTPEKNITDTTTAEPAKKMRNQELVQCAKCQKWVTPKTLKYTHSLKCGVEKYQPGRPKKSKIEINETVQEETPPDPVPVQKVEVVRKPHVQRQQPPKTIVKEVVKTFEELRRERFTERMKQRQERNINLFKQVL